MCLRLVSASTVQLGISCKKGCGGTYPARCAARRLRSGQHDELWVLLDGQRNISRIQVAETESTAGCLAGVLSMLLDELPPTARKPCLKTAWRSAQLKPSDGSYPLGKAYPTDIA